MIVTVTNVADNKQMLLNLKFVVAVNDWGKGSRITLSVKLGEKPEIFIKETAQDIKLLMRGTQIKSAV